MSEQSPWRLEGFVERFEAWASHDRPTADERLLVLSWVMTRYDDPYHGVMRADGFENLWFGVIPATRGPTVAIVCSYFIVEQSRTVRCDNFARLGLPL